MQTKALVVIDIQNDITKHYRDIVDNINAYYEKQGCEEINMSEFMTPLILV